MNFWQTYTYKRPHHIFVRNTDSSNRDYNLGLISMLQLNECTTVLLSSGTPVRYKLETSEAYSLQSVAYGAKKFTRSLCSWTKGNTLAFEMRSPCAWGHLFKSANTCLATKWCTWLSSSRHISILPSLSLTGMGRVRVLALRITVILVVVLLHQTVWTSKY